jgi:hypothetical protein
MPGGTRARFEGSALPTSSAGSSIHPKACEPRVHCVFLDLQHIGSPESKGTLLAKPRRTWNETSIARFTRSTRACV